jgi:hypothetical protein
VKIQATALSPDTGKKVEFTPRWHLNRPGLLFLGGVVYLAFGSHGDEGEFWGWIMAYSAKTLEQLAVHCTAIDWGEGGVWQSGNGLAGEEVKESDGATHYYTYAVVGNGQKPVVEPENGGAPVPQPNIPFTGIKAPIYGNSLLKLELVKRDVPVIGARPKEQGDPATPYRFDVIDWYTAPDCLDLNQIDQDLISGPVLFEATRKDQPPLTMVLGGGKDGRYYLADRTNLGHWSSLAGGTPYHVADQVDGKTGKPVIDPKTGTPRKVWQPWKDGQRPPNQILQDDQMCEFHIHGTPVIWKKPDGAITSFAWSENDFLKAYEFDMGMQKFRTTPQSTSQYGLPPHELRMPGGILALSANPENPGSAILWASHTTDDDGMNKTVKGTLRAFDARDLNNEVWTSDMNTNGDDRVGSFAKFCPPVIANGKVYLATFSRELVVYGLLSKERGDVCEAFVSRGIGAQGSCTYSCGRYNLSASGQGLLPSVSDSFFFSYQEVDTDAIAGRGVSIAIQARVLGLHAPALRTDARAGLMIRLMGGKDAGDDVMPYAAVVVTPLNKALFQRRVDVKTESNQDGPFPAPIPYWLKLTAESVRPGILSFEGKISDDGRNWKLISAVTEIAMNGRVHIGLVATAQTGKTVGPSPDHVEVSFSDVEVTL